MLLVFFTCVNAASGLGSKWICLAGCIAVTSGASPLLGELPLLSLTSAFGSPLTAAGSAGEFLVRTEPDLAYTPDVS